MSAIIQVPALYWCSPGGICCVCFRCGSSQGCSGSCEEGMVRSCAIDL